MSLFPRYTAAKVNRSFAFSPEVLATLIAITARTVQNTAAAFAAELDKLDISAEERDAAIHMLAAGVSKGIADVIESWKDQYRQPRRAK